jgi:hypothetical protein
VNFQPQGENSRAYFYGPEMVYLAHKVTNRSLLFANGSLKNKLIYANREHMSMKCLANGSVANRRLARS